MKKTTPFYPRVQVDTAPSSAVAQAGGVTLDQTIALTGLGAGLQVALGPWRKPFAVHDPAKVLLDLALTLALGGERLADVAVIRAEPSLYGLVASDPTISRTIDALTADASAVLKAIDGARAQARARAWAMAGDHASNHHADAHHPVVIDLDATLVTAHSVKEQRDPGLRRTTWSQAPSSTQERTAGELVESAVARRGQPVEIGSRRPPSSSRLGEALATMCHSKLDRLARPEGDSTMAQLLYPLALLACPIGMGLMMWMMMRGGKEDSKEPSSATTAAEVTRLRAEVDQLRAAQRRPVKRE